MKRLHLLVVVFIFSAFSVSGLGISPAIRNVDFVPNQRIEIPFYVLDTVEGQFYDLSLRGGELANYSSLSHYTVKGGGKSVLTINFPDKISKPGEHFLSVSVKERPSEESFINTIVEVGGLVKVFVPYPGIYGDLALNIPDGNVGESIPVELYVANKGDKDLDLTSVFIDFISNNGTHVKKLDFTPILIPVNGERYFRKYLDTTDLEPGNYIGSARVSYSGSTNEVNKSFRVGSLFVNITNFTNYLTTGGIRKFYVTLENKWNSPISGVFVDVNLSNDFDSLLFRTPFIDLKPWEQKTVESFIDTNGLEGNYNLILNATYHGKSTIAYGSVFIGKDYSLIVYGVSAFISLIFFIVLYFGLRRFFRGRK